MDFAMESLKLTAAVKDFISGAVAGAFAITVSQPLDTVRVRLQQSHTTSGPRPNTMNVLLTMVRQEGLLSPFKGLTYPLLFASVQSAILFQAYGWTLRQLDTQNQSQPNSSPSPANPSPPPQKTASASFSSPSSPHSPSGTHSPPPSPASSSAGVHHLHLHTTHHHNMHPQQPGAIHGPGTSPLGQAIAWPWTHSGMDLSNGKSTGHPDVPSGSGFSGSWSESRITGTTALNVRLPQSASEGSTMTAVALSDSCGASVVEESLRSSRAAPDGDTSAGQGNGGGEGAAGDAPAEEYSSTSTNARSESGSSGGVGTGQAIDGDGRGGMTAGAGSGREMTRTADGVEAADVSTSQPLLSSPQQQEQQHQRSKGGQGAKSEAGIAAGLTPWHGVIAGGVAGCAQVFLWSPVELLKLRSQLQTAAHGSTGYKNPAALAMQVLRQEGVPGLYRGFTLTVVRDVPSYALYFWLYRDIASALSPGLDPEMAPPATQVLAGGLAGVLAWMPVYPLDVIKTRVQAVTASASRGKTVAHYARDMYQEGGARAFFRGLPPTLARAFLMDGASFLGYTATLKWLGGSATPESANGAAVGLPAGSLAING